MGSEVEKGAWGKGEEKKISEEKNGEADGNREETSTEEKIENKSKRSKF